MHRVEGNRREGTRMPYGEEDIQDMEDNPDKADIPPCEVASRTVLPRNPEEVEDILEAE